MSTAVATSNQTLFRRCLALSFGQLLTRWRWPVSAGADMVAKRLVRMGPMNVVPLERDEGSTVSLE